MFIIPDEWEFITANNESGKYLFTKLEISLMPSNTSIFDMILKNISIIHIIYTTLLNLLKNIIVRIISTNIIIKSIKITPSVIITYFIFFNLYKIITLIFMLLSSILIFLGLFILAAAYCFVTIKGLEVRNVFTDGGKHMAQYPIGIFRKGIVVIFTFIIPYGFVNYYPLLYILGKKSSNLYVISPLITIIYLIPCIIIFYKGVKKYSGVGS